MTTAADRRVHRLYLTRHSEYLMRADLCIGVRDRTTGEWDLRHRAVGQRAKAMVSVQAGVPRFHVLSPRSGSALYFADGPVLTGAVRNCIRPSHYDYEAWRLAAEFFVREAKNTEDTMKDVG